MILRMSQMLPRSPTECSDGIAVDDGPNPPFPHDHIGGLLIDRLAGFNILPDAART
jgi:hypothetical protein